MSNSLNVEGLTGFQRGKKYSFEGRPVVFGTSDGCDVRFDPVWDKTVSAQHATVRFDKGHWILEDRSQQGTFIAGRRIVRETLPGDCTMELGKGGPKIRLSSAAPASSPASASRGATVSGGFSVSFRWLAMGAGALALIAAGIGVFSWVHSRNSAGSNGASGSTTLALTEPMTPGKEPNIPESARPEVSTPGAGKTPAEPNAPSKPPAAVAMPQWELVVGMGEEIFPSFIIASATMKETPFDKLNKTPDRLGDVRGAIGIRIASPAARTKVHVEIKENEYLHGSSLDVELPEAGATYGVYPPINYRYDSLSKVKQTIPLTLTAEVTVNGSAHDQKTKTVRVASINECPHGLVIDEKHVMRMDWMFAAYVNENHPIADQLRKEALQAGVIKNFTGYQSGEQGVYQQVFAIWNALQRRGVTYSSITETPGANSAVYSQSVRFIDQSINNSQANCVDGSVLFASILRQIGIEAILVLPPGHCFVGFVVDPKAKKIDYIETTALGDRNPRPSRRGSSSGRRSARMDAVGAIEETASVEDFTKAAVNFAPPNVESLQLFRSAVESAREEARQGDPNLVWISDAREMGVLPIGFTP